MGLDEAAAELQDADADPEEVASTFKNAAPNAYKQVRKEHYKEGKSEVEDELNSAQDKIASLRKEKKSLEEKMEGEESPEVEELRDNYESKINQLESQVDEARTEKEQAVQEWKERTRAVKGTSFKQKVASILKDQGVDEDYAEFKAQEAVSGDRVQFEGDNGLDIGVYEDGVPLPTSDDQAKHEAFASSLADEVPDKFIDDPRPGSTMNGSPAGSTSGNQVTRSQFEEMSQSERMEFSREGGEVVPD